MRFKTPAVAVAAFIAGSMTLPSVVGAQSDDTPTDTPVPAEAVEAVPGDGELDLQFPETLEGEAIEIENYEPSAEEIDEWNAETDQLIDALKQAGIAVTVETDESGLRYPVFAEDLSEADWEKVDGVFVSVFGEFDEALGDVALEELDFEDYEPTAEELAEWNAETEEIIAELEAAGIPVERDEHEGFIMFDLPEELTEEQEALVEDLFGDCEELEADLDDADEADDIEPSVDV